MRRLTYILFALSLFIFLISLRGYFLSMKPIQTQTFYASMNISDSFGFDLNSSALTFGKVAFGGSSARNIKIQNGFDFPVIAVVHAEGDIMPLLNFEEIVKIDKGETKSVPFSVSALPEIDDGFYSGNVSFELYRRR